MIKEIYYMFKSQKIYILKFQVSKTHTMATRVVEFSKLERFLPQNQHTQKKFLNFENLFIQRCQKVTKFDFQIQFSMLELSGSFSIFFIEEY